MRFVHIISVLCALLVAYSQARSTGHSGWDAIGAATIGAATIGAALIAIGRETHSRSRSRSRSRKRPGSR
jgi:hypothetical protein